MKCINCGAEIKSEFNVCPYCGTTVQMVPDYNVYDEDDINVLLEETKDVESKNNKAYIKEQKEKEEKERKKAVQQAKLKKERNKKILIISVCIAVALLVIIGVVVGVVKNNNSYDYQMKQADSAMFKGDVDAAEEYYLKALSIEPEDIEVRLELADLYIDKNEQDKAISLLEEVLDKDSENLDAYKMFFIIYSKNGDVDAIYTLLDGVKNTKILSIFEDYVVDTPTFNNKTGDYANNVKISLKAKKGLDIYYTIDGSDPKTNGIKYEDVIEFEEEGEHVVKAVTKNASGVYSLVVTETYTVKFEAPADPVVKPDGGTFYEPTYVYVIVPEGCVAVYTWDKSDPTMYSSLYTSPLLIPEGYNVFSVMIIDAKSGLTSSIYRGAFEYIVQ